MTSNKTVENLQITEDLRCPGLNKGTILSHDGVNKFLNVAPTMSTQVLTSDSTQPSGVRWNNGTQNSGFSVMGKDIPIPLQGADYYFMTSGATSFAKPFILPACQCVYFTLNTNTDGYVSNRLTNLNSGALNFYMGYYGPNVQPSALNTIYYATGTTTRPGVPDFTISFDSLNPSGNYNTYTTASINYTVTAGQQVTMVISNTLGNSAAKPSFGSFSMLLLFRGI